MLRLYLLALLFAILAVAALAIDLPAAAFFRRGHSLHGDVAKLVTLAETFGHGMGAACILLAVWVVDLPKRRPLLRVAFGVFAAGQLTNLVKLCVGRTRPSAGPPESVTATFVTWFPSTAATEVSDRLDSFPSGHTATAVALAIGLSLLYPRGRAVFWCFAALAALQRLHSLSHYPSDVLTGAALACLICCWCQAPHYLGKWFDRFEARGGSHRTAPGFP